MVFKAINFLAPLGHPIGLLWLLLVAGALVLLKQHKPRGAVFLILLAAFLSAIGTRPVPDYLLGRLERPYAQQTLDKLEPGDAVVVLGGSHRPSPHDAFGFDLGAQADRLMTGIEVVRQKKARAFVMGGMGSEVNGKRSTDADLLQPWIQAWKLPATEVHSLGFCLNTHDEALKTQALMKDRGWTNIILVTSAFHMKRAEAVFKKLGIRCVPAPCDFQVIRGDSPDTGIRPFPKIDNVQKTEFYVHELCSWWIYKWRGWL